jgi:hypothetical protein
MSYFSHSNYALPGTNQSTKGHGFHPAFESQIVPLLERGTWQFYYRNYVYSANCLKKARQPDFYSQLEMPLLLKPDWSDPFQKNRF